MTLAALFGLNLGQVDLTYDFLTILSLLGVIPLTLYLRREYLKLKEKDKSILVLKKDQEEAYKNVIEEALANKVSNFASTLRQPINDVKQLVYFLQHSTDKKKNETHLEQIQASAQEALTLLKSFEEETTGKKLTLKTRSL